MPITGPSSYLVTIDEFIAHWTAVNAALVGGGGTALVLEGNRTLAGLQTLRTNLAAARTDVELKLNIAEIARAESLLKRRLVLGRCGQLADNVRANWSGTAIVAGLRPLAAETDSAAKIETMADDMASLWSLLNAAPAPAGITLPLTLPPLSNNTVPVPPPYVQSALAIDIAIMKGAHTALKTALVNLSNARAAREALEAQVRDCLPDYRKAVEAKLPPDHPLIASLPRYSPLPGSTPEPASANGMWNAATSLADITFTPSASASVVRYELRYVAGPDYHADDESVAGSLLVGSPLVFNTLAGLPGPGTTASYRVYAITAEGNERASNTVVVARP